MISCDTKSENLEKHTKGADILIHEVVAKRLVNLGADDLTVLGHPRLAAKANALSDASAT